MEPLISVIVPVYKVEAYLRPCVESILGQSYTNMEIILVDDGSPDGCPAICDELAAKDGRVQVIHKPNGGLSDARNAGMAASTGEYLMFVDSDDLLPENAVQTLMQIALQDGADLVIGGHARFDEQPPHISGTASQRVILSAEEAMADMLRGGCAAWARVYRRSIHEGIEFPVGEINEDEAIVLGLYERCGTIAKTDAVVYFYRCRPESITTASYNPKKLVWVKHCANNLTFIRQNHPTLEPLAAQRYRGSLMWSITEMILSKADFSAQIQEFRRQLRQEKKLFRRIPFSNKQDKLRFFLLTNGPLWFYRLIIRAKRGN